VTIDITEPANASRPWRVPMVLAGALATLLVFTLAAFIAINGRFDLTMSGRHVAIRRVTPVSLIGWLIAIGTAGLMGRSSRELMLAHATSFVRRYGAALAGILAIGVGAAAMVRGAFTAAGADLYGYVSQGLLWAKGNPVQMLPALALAAPVDAAAFCPLGYRPGVVPGTMVPTYPAGLPLQMAALVDITGPPAVYLVVPLTAALAVWSTYRIARHFAPASPALLATACTACSPVFLFQMMQPMSDVPVTAWWLLAILFVLTGSVVSAIGAGLAASVAVLTRPNIVPLILPVAAFWMIREFRSPRSRSWSVPLFLAACAPGIALVGAINQVLYGSALASGYGSPRDIYHVSDVTANARQYLSWLWTTHSIYVFIPCLVPLLAALGHGRIQRRTEQFGWCALGFAGVLLGCYVFFERFDHWTYLRFLLPTIPVLIVATTALLNDALSGARRGTRAAVFAFIAATLPFAYVHTASRGDAFALKSGLRHSFEDAASFAVARLPPNAVYLTLTESGSLRHYGGLLTIRYDLVEPSQADRLVTYLRDRGLVAYAALTRDELSSFRRRFENTSVGRAAAADGMMLPPVGQVLFFPIDKKE
jgi:hypothetical protein